ncbi:hypothetical protein JVU11DRAFT_1969 [Chiua virens]|nr:hypothetical protein JVU11DRAFT_1969 [Chiua virens]
MPCRLNNLGDSLRIRFKYLGELGDLEEAISMLTEAVNLPPDGHPVHLNSLGVSLFTRFARFGERRDLEDAILQQELAVGLIPSGHPHKPKYLSNLGNLFRARFEQVGELGDLEKAISRQTDAIGLTPHGHPLEPSYLSNLGSSFRTRFDHLGEPCDLDDAISRLQGAVDLGPHDHPETPGYLNNLGISFLSRFRRLGEMNDLEQAVSKLKDAVDLTSQDHPSKPTYLNNLGSSFVSRFCQLGELPDLEQAISSFQLAVDLTPDGHSNKPARLFNLGNHLHTRFRQLGELGDLEAAISRMRDAVDLTPLDHPDRFDYMSSLGSCFATRFQNLGDVTALEQAISLYSHAACASTGAIAVRLRASQGWILCARILNHHSLLGAYSVAISLVPQLAWIGLSLAQRFHELVRGADVVREAAATALGSGHPETAVEWLEQGRSIVWGELFQLRSSYDELSSVHPNHARKLQELSTALEEASSSRENSFSSSMEPPNGEPRMQSLQEVAAGHRALAIDRDKLLREIRGLPGFERFLLHKEFSSLRASACAGPVVILNTAKSRCDALIVLADVENAIHVPLPNFTFDRSKGLQDLLRSLLGPSRIVPCDERVGQSVVRRRISWESLLSILWNGIVKPVLDALGFSTPGDLSRIFWCPTGPFTFLPLHAAGLYGTQSSKPGHAVSDFVVSSYLPTLSILSFPRQPNARSRDQLRLLAVRQPATDGQSRLPGVDLELGHIATVIQNVPSARATFVASPTGTVEQVLALMQDADWVHFACHGIQDAQRPTESGLGLADGRRLRVVDMMSLSRDRREDGGDRGLAFLSACQTATGDRGLSDEAIHIAAGMLFAGYGGVVGTMWSISDRVAPSLARDVYEQLFQRVDGNGANSVTPDYREAARALHGAIGRLREGGASFVEWLPFIHVGL